jgi:hypothetical protein
MRVLSKEDKGRGLRQVNDRMQFLDVVNNRARLDKRFST